MAFLLERDHNSNPSNVETTRFISGLLKLLEDKFLFSFYTYREMEIKQTFERSILKMNLLEQKFFPQFHCFIYVI